MFKNYLTVAIRNLMRHKAYSLINIFGLAIGMACCIVILSFIQDELSYDQYHANSDRLYRVMRETRTGENTRVTSGTSGALSRVLAQEFPEIEKVTRAWTWSARVQNNDKVLWQNLCAIDPSFLDLFDFPLVKGDHKTALQNHSSILISESMAKQYFGDNDPIGQILNVQDRTFGGDFTIAGILKDAPPNSTFQFDLLTTHVKSEGLGPWENWRPVQGWRPVQNWMLLKNGTDVKALESKLQNIIVQYMGKEIAQNNTYRLQPLSRIYLYSKVDYGIDWYSDIQSIYLLSVIALFILLIACINFMNLATARSTNRAREVGLRKVVGAYRTQLIGQFVGEALLMSCLALLLALGLVELSLPYFNTFVSKTLSINVLSNPQTSIGLVAIMLISGLLAGSYPAFFLSAFRPIETLKGTLNAGTKGAWLRKGLVVAQFALSILMMIGTAVVYQQLDFMRNKNLGYNQDQTVVLPIFTVDQWTQPDQSKWLADRYNVVKNEFKKHPNVLDASAFRPYLGYGWGLRRKIRAQDHETENRRMPILEVDESFIDFFDIELLQGRNFSTPIASDTSQPYILNEAAVKQFGWDNPIGKSFEWVEANDDGSRKGQVIGVVKDFHFASLRENIEPVALALRSHHFYHLGVKVHAENMDETMAFLEKTWFQFIPKGYEFQHSFMNEEFEHIYANEQRLGTMTTTFSSLAIFLAGLGLLGLASYSAQQRRKEIGVRKVLGVSIQGVVLLLSKDFIKLVIIANIIAWPVAYFATHHWLQDFPYRIQIGPLPFLFGALSAVMIAITTVSYQAIKAAHTNPVDALRDE